MAPPPSTVVPPVVALIVRVLTFVCLLISIIVIATTTTTAYIDSAAVEIKFNDFYAYRYMLATGVIGIAYTLLQIAFTIFFVSTGKRAGGDGLALFDFYGDKALSYMLATGAAAGFGLTVDLNRLGANVDGFLNKANAAASLVFIGFLFSAISSIFSSFSLPKRY